MGIINKLSLSHFLGDTIFITREIRVRNLHKIKETRIRTRKKFVHAQLSTCTNCVHKLRDTISFAKLFVAVRSKNDNTKTRRQARHYDKCR